ncbi:MAG: DUF1801 domain-containing protein [Anaerolineales bacterium]
MMEDTPRFTSVDEYIASFPAEIQILLRQVQAAIRAAVPEAQEKISYQMPTFFLHGNIAHFAAFKRHIGFYPAPRGIEAFKEELSLYKGAKGSVQFPFDQPLPLHLIAKIARFRADENLKRQREKRRA